MCAWVCVCSRVCMRERVCSGLRSHQRLVCQCVHGRLFSRVRHSLRLHSCVLGSFVCVCVCVRVVVCVYRCVVCVCCILTYCIGVFARTSCQFSRFRSMQTTPLSIRQIVSRRDDHVWNSQRHWQYHMLVHVCVHLCVRVCFCQCV